MCAPPRCSHPRQLGASLERSFGRPVLRYAERAWASDNKEERIALCDLASHDPDVLEAHYHSNLVIAGRYGTVFRNAFIVRLPITHEAVVRVWSPMEPPEFPIPEVSLEDVWLPPL
jgi:hypothetical protein